MVEVIPQSGFLPYHFFRSPPQSGICIEVKDCHGWGIDNPSLLGEGVRLFISLDVNMSGDPLDGAGFLPCKLW